MSYIFSQALVAEFLPASCSATAACALSSSTPTPQAFSCDDKTMATYRRSRYGLTCGPLTPDHGEALLSAFRADSLARTFPLPATVTGSTESAADCGASSPGWLAKWNQLGSGWRTAQCSLLGGWTPYSETWPRSGSMRNGTLYPRSTLVPSISVNASGSLLPTLTVYGNHNAPKEGTDRGYGLSTALKLLPTLCAIDAGTEPRELLPTLTCQDAEQAGGKGAMARGTRGATLHQAVQPYFPTLTAASSRSGRRSSDRANGEGPNLLEALSEPRELLPTLAARDFRHPNKTSYKDRGGGAKGEQLPNSVGGPLNADWCEWFMGKPIGWTASSALETAKYREWLQQHSPRWVPCCADASSE